MLPLALHTTVRQYGEVVLPDPAPTEASGASTGQSPVSLATKLSRCKEGMARVFAVQVQILPKCWRDRGTSLIGAANLSPVTKLVANTGVASRYNLSRSQKSVKVY